MKRKTPPEVGYRASEEFTRYARENGITFAQASELTGIDRKASCEWWHGNSPSASSLVGLASIGIDVGYIITGKRTPKVVHAHWVEVKEPDDPEDAKHFRCSHCNASAFAKGADLKKTVTHCMICGAIMDEVDNKCLKSFF